ncbi:hypothetical protein A1Q1_06664 [Trichosporon asahii var. asahii CBS 2479]|uniref:holo-[acyl-carrier-protein] synthase n=1 Tax=Trichosporon asahii var. asahii (strain ATCC 90039 / CBS 2479 / JCM 2466 / KCTC 7840 / NBRC 103889/ NCYC 2677 / UAMH 7654) TaxID=1186058 RepID=J5TQB3_TRIAS|nr:hypothetical protein A1Q1_06664 [Trichosporon asahii var. asahii CBS 2479]EJT52126.1 hypothetical protein A1Q1_06664 [Trichosporon asahii var. asahii CBS 2479]
MVRLFSLKMPQETFDRLLHHLPERAQDRVRRFRHPDDAVRSLAARLLPTWYLREAGIVAPSEHPKFGVAPRGKPYLLDPTAKVGFNTTHEGEYVLLAVGDGEVGVDVMDLPKDPQELEEGISFQDERLGLSTTSGIIKSKYLTTLWTMKEGYTKAIGTGISFGLDRINVHVGDGQVSALEIDGKNARLDGWHWAVGSLDAGAYGWAVIWNGEDDQTVTPEPLDWNSFVRSFIGHD